MKQQLLEKRRADLEEVVLQAEGQVSKLDTLIFEIHLQLSRSPSSHFEWESLRLRLLDHIDTEREKVYEID